MDTSPSDRPERRSPAFWVVCAVLLVSNIWYDYYHPLGIIFDVVLALVLLVRYVGKSE